MKKGRAKCKALKEIRKQIADANDIPYVVSQCTYQGDCKGTCPKCEAELKYLERELAVRQSLGKAVAIAGISLGACSTLTACAPIDEAAQFLRSLGQDEQTAGSFVAPEELDGDIAIPLETEEPLSGAFAIPEETEEPFAGEALPPDETCPVPEETLIPEAGYLVSPVEAEEPLSGDIAMPEDVEGGIEYE